MVARWSARARSGAKAEDDGPEVLPTTQQVGGWVLPDTLAVTHARCSPRCSPRSIQQPGAWGLCMAGRPGVHCNWKAAAALCEPPAKSYIGRGARTPPGRAGLAGTATPLLAMQATHQTPLVHQRDGGSGQREGALCGQQYGAAVCRGAGDGDGVISMELEPPRCRGPASMPPPSQGCRSALHLSPHRHPPAHPPASAPHTRADGGAAPLRRATDTWALLLPIPLCPCCVLLRCAASCRAVLRVAG